MYNYKQSGDESQRLAKKYTKTSHTAQIPPRAVDRGGHVCYNGAIRGRERAAPEENTEERA